MRVRLQRLREHVRAWITHPKAPFYLGFLSFIESFCFPIIPDVMLIPMVFFQKHRAWYYLGITVVTSVVGGVVGYYIGLFAMDSIYPWIVSAGYTDAYQLLESWFHRWGIAALLIAAITPIPYKLFTLVAGALHMNLWSFICFSFIGRTVRFGLVTVPIYFFGESAAQAWKRWRQK